MVALETFRGADTKNGLPSSGKSFSFLKCGDLKCFKQSGISSKMFKFLILKSLNFFEKKVKLFKNTSQKIKFFMFFVDF